jgi:hypothetical protein
MLPCSKEPHSIGLSRPVFHCQQVQGSGLESAGLDQSPKESAERGSRRVDGFPNRTGLETLGRALQSLNLRSLAQVDRLEVLKRVVLALEKEATASSPAT